MVEHPMILLVAGVILGFGVFSRLSEKSIISAPMVFVAVGLAASFFLDAEVKSNVHAPWVKVVAEVTLILVLFIDALNLNVKELIRDRQLPIRLLGVGLPLTMVLGILVAIPMFPGVNIWLLAMMALILSPTDAALGIAVVTSESVPAKIRQTINVESGLNDGIALPPILVCMAVLSGNSEDSGFTYWAIFVAKQFVFGPAVGGLIGWLFGYVVEVATKRGWMNTTFQRLAAISIAIMAYTFAEMIHGNGFIAAYFAGMLLGTRAEELRENIHGFGEAAAQILTLLIFMLVGLILIPITFPFWDLRAFGYALLSLTVIRMVPVALSLIGTGLDRKTVWFIGWFGPRGIASILYMLMAVIVLGRSGNEQIMAVISLTVVMSIVLHGITSVPLTRIFLKESSD
jgi:NhaP-type Na+/H+ or K+/H+ antiporter